MTNKADIYSFGVLIYKLLHNREEEFVRINRNLVVDNNIVCGNTPTEIRLNKAIIVSFIINYMANENSNF